jgi:hypothetical protein
VYTPGTRSWGQLFTTRILEAATRRSCMLQLVHRGTRAVWLRARLEGVAGLALAAFAILLGGSGSAAAATGGGRIAYTAGLSPAPAVWTAQADGSGAQKLGLGSHPLVSPNGSLVAAGGISPQGMPLGQVVLYPTTGSEAVPVSLAGETVAPVAFSPDSKYIAVEFTRGTSGGGLAVLDVETHSLAYVSNKATAGASFNPAGSDELVFAAYSGSVGNSPTNLYTWAPGAATPTRITSDGRSLYPVWGPGYIAFTRERQHRYRIGGRSFGQPRYQIWIRNSNGSLRQLTHLAISYLQLGLIPIAISASGAQMVAEFEQQDIPLAYSVNVSNGSARPLLRNRITFAQGISADGTRALVGRFNYDGAHDAVLSVPLAGGRPTVLVEGKDILEPSWNE